MLQQCPSANGNPRSAWIVSIRAALATAEQVAQSLSHKGDVCTAAQALVHRLASIRAEVDFLESSLGTDHRDPVIRLPEGDHRHRQIRS